MKETSVFVGLAVVDTKISSQFRYVGVTVVGTTPAIVTGMTKCGDGVWWCGVVMG